MSEERTPRYRIEESDRAEADRESAYLRLMSLLGPEYADVWHNGLLEAIAGLADFPGPLAHGIVRERTVERQEVRRLLYYGPKGRRSRTQMRYRVLFMVLPPAEDEEEAVVRILRIMHGASSEHEGPSGETA